MGNEVMQSEQHGPWVIKSKREFYHHDVITVREDDVVKPDGQPGTYAMLKIAGGASVFPFGGEYVYLAQEYRYAVGRETVETCAGAIDEGESQLDAAKRELREELAIEAASWAPLGTLELMTLRIDSPSTLFLAEELTFVEKEDDDNERIKVVKKPLEEAVHLALNGEIKHASSCMLILRAHQTITQATTQNAKRGQS